MNAPRVLILGGSGVVGRALRRHYGSANAVATSHRRSFPGSISFDATTQRLAEAVLPIVGPCTHALILLGITDIDACARDSLATARLNIDGIRSVLDDLHSAGIMPIFISSDAVFDGSRGGWTETDPPSPTLTYGKQKRAIEEIVAASSHPWLIVRLAKVVDTASTHGDWLGDWCRRLEVGTELRAAHDQYLSPIAASEVAEGLAGLIEQKVTGIYHLGGPRVCSRLTLVQSLVEAAHEVGLPMHPQIVPCSIGDFPFVEPRPRRTDMDSSKVYRTLGRTMSDYQAICRMVARTRLQELRGADHA